jgi:hypothetical protein
MNVTYGLVAGVVEHIRVNIDRLTSDLVGPSGVVSDATDDGANIAAGHVDGLAIVKRLDCGKQLAIGLTQVGKLVHELGSLVWRNAAPSVVECLSGGRNSDIDILLRGLAD